MEYVHMLNTPALKKPQVVAVFDGWSDAEKASTTVIRYLTDLLPAKRFGEIDPEEFYEFTTVRPVAIQDERGERAITWPVNEFRYWRNEGGENDLLLILGTEPNLKWRTYTSLLMRLLEPYDVSLVVTLGSLLAPVPHTRDSKMQAYANRPDLLQKLEKMGVEPLVTQTYQGPVGISSVFSEACEKRGYACTRIWASAPHYLQSVTNYKVSFGLFRLANDLLGLDLPLKMPQDKARAFEKEVSRALVSNNDVRSYVQKLEQEYDKLSESQGESQEGLPPPDAMVKELEEFLKKQQGNGTKDSE